MGSKKADTQQASDCHHCKGPCEASRWDYHCEACGALLGPETGSWHYCSTLRRYAHASKSSR